MIHLTLFRNKVAIAFFQLNLDSADNYKCVIQVLAKQGGEIMMVNNSVTEGQFVNSNLDILRVQLMISVFILI